MHLGMEIITLFITRKKSGQWQVQRILKGNKKLRLKGWKQEFQAC